MKKEYAKPVVLVVLVEPHNMVCASITGVAETGNLTTTVSNEESDEYLSRRSSSAWD